MNIQKCVIITIITMSTILILVIPWSLRTTVTLDTENIQNSFDIFV